MKWSWLRQWWITLLLATALVVPGIVLADACGKCVESNYSALGPCGQCIMEILFDWMGGW